MPLLKWNVDLFPAGLFELPENDFPWWVAHVRSRQEKALARNLFPLEIPFYLPQREKRIRRAGRAFVSYIPLFPGYLFFRGSAAQRSAALRSKLIVKVLEVTDQGLLAGELLQIRRLQETGADLVPFTISCPAIRCASSTGHSKATQESCFGRGERCGSWFRFRC